MKRTRPAPQPSLPLLQVRWNSRTARFDRDTGVETIIQKACTYFKAGSLRTLEYTYVLVGQIDGVESEVTDDMLKHLPSGEIVTLTTAPVISTPPICARETPLAQKRLIKRSSSMEHRENAEDLYGSTPTKSPASRRKSKNVSPGPITFVVFAQYVTGKMSAIHIRPTDFRWPADSRGEGCRIGIWDTEQVCRPYRVLAARWQATKHPWIRRSGGCGGFNAKRP
ncbi:hypothetical protein C8Q74DRAFT_1251536 [Fomes fomentarius]|nr:hypothetical protein C8Q74DRAFT_1251536 [Fomes fomentarius]